MVYLGLPLTQQQFPLPPRRLQFTSDRIYNPIKTLRVASSVLPRGSPFRRLLKSIEESDASSAPISSLRLQSLALLGRTTASAILRSDTSNWTHAYHLPLSVCLLFPFLCPDKLTFKPPRWPTTDPRRRGNTHCWRELLTGM